MDDEEVVDDYVESYEEEKDDAEESEEGIIEETKDVVDERAAKPEKVSGLIFMRVDSLLSEYRIISVAPDYLDEYEVANFTLSKLACSPSNAKTILESLSKKPEPFFQLIPHLQCCKPINCCFIFLPQLGHTLLLFPIGKPIPSKKVLFYKISKRKISL